VKLKKAHLGAGALALGAVLAFALPAGASVNLQSESSGGSILKIAKNAQIKAKGAATVVTLTLTCPAGARAQVAVDVAQAVNGNTVVRGSGYANDVTCTGGAQKLKIAVLAGPAPWKLGVAYAVGHADIYGNGYYAHLDTDREIVNVQS
jgi:hypothetical protein